MDEKEKIVFSVLYYLAEHGTLQLTAGGERIDIFAALEDPYEIADQVGIGYTEFGDILSSLQDNKFIQVYRMGDDEEFVFRILKLPDCEYCQESSTVH